jgi:hypothetical protein
LDFVIAHRIPEWFVRQPRRHAIVRGGAEIALASRREQAPADQHVRERARDHPACARSLENRSATARLARLSANERYQNPAKKR